MRFFKIGTSTDCQLIGVRRTSRAAGPIAMRILVVENHPDTLRWLQLHLEDSGHEVTTACDVEAAKTALQSGKYNVLISDIGLPDGSGWELLERAEEPRNFLAIAMSGLGRTADAVRSREAGFQHHLFKPFPLSYLDKLLEEAA